MAGKPQVVLASASETRRRLLVNAGIPITWEASDVDEQPIKEAGRRSGWDVTRTVLSLAEAKARAVARAHPGMHIIGADQILECDGRLYDKAADRDAARRVLVALRGRRHRLVCGTVVVRDDAVLWSDVDVASLTMRPFTDAFLDAYLDSLGLVVTESVGGYRLEGLGVQLFSDLEGDFFSVLGLPLMALLAFLRKEGVLPT